MWVGEFWIGYSYEQAAWSNARCEEDQLDCVFQKGTKQSIEMLLRFCNFILGNKTPEIMQKDEIYIVIFVLNLQFFGL